MPSNAASRRCETADCLCQFVSAQPIADTGTFVRAALDGVDQFCRDETWMTLSGVSPGEKNRGRPRRLPRTQWRRLSGRTRRHCGARRYDNHIRAMGTHGAQACLCTKLLMRSDDPCRGGTFMWRCWKDVARAYLRFFLSSPAYRQVGAEGTLMRRDRLRFGDSDTHIRASR
jgi:hypothetical protein